MTTAEDLMEQTKINYTQESDIQGKFEITIQAGLVSDRMAQAYKNLQRNAQIPGFRKGKVPMNVVKQQYKNQVIRDTFERLVSDTTRVAAIQEKVPVIGEPRVTKTNWLTWEEGTDMEYEARVELVPDPKLKKYKGLEVTVQDQSVDKQQVEDVLDRFRQSKAVIEAVEENRGVKGDDIVIVDFQGELEGEMLEDAKADNFMIEVDSPNTLPEFQESLIGMKAGDEKKIPVSYADDYGNERIAGKTVTYTVKLHEIKKKNIPEWTDELAKEFEADSVEDLRKQISDNLERSAKLEEKSALEEQVLVALIDANKFDVPQTLISHQLNRILRDLAAALEKQHFSSTMIEDYMKKHVEELQTRAEREVQLALLLPKVVDAEKFEITDEDVADRIEKIAASTGKDKKEVETYYKSDERKQELKGQIARDKGIDLMVENAKVKREKKKK